MPDASAAPAAPTTPANTQQTQLKTPPQQVDAKAAKPATTPDAKPPEQQVDPKAKWRDSVKDLPFRVKHKGEEKSLADMDPEELVNYAQRGYGASKLVEDANKAKAEADKVLALRKAIDGGSEEEALDAILQLGGKRAFALLQRMQAAQQAREESLANVPPEVRQLIEEREALKAEQAQWRAQQERQQREAEEAEFAKTQTQIRADAVTRAGAILKAMNLPPEKADIMGAHVIRAMREANEVGQELGVDVSPEQILSRAEELARGSTLGVLDGLSPGALFEHLGEERVAKLANEYLVRMRLKRAPAAPQEEPTAPAPKRNERQQAPRIGDPRYLRL